jgi:hypothetical protein
LLVASEKDVLVCLQEITDRAWLYLKDEEEKAVQFSHTWAHEAFKRACGIW